MMEFALVKEKKAWLEVTTGPDGEPQSAEEAIRRSRKITDLFQRLEVTLI
jgi:hypothetical protein